ncbi:MAG TPA: peptidase [candidate division Zixibacteria bacterium]|jgi:serine protease Do|nr:peptidase [candidate division Zixibacteria bacterium]
MKKGFLLTLCLIVLTFANALAKPQVQNKGLAIFDELKSLIISVADSITPAVVHIEVVKKQDTQRFQALGSGVIIDRTGYILTNEHVVDKYVEVTVTPESNREYRAEVIGTDKLTDLALLKIDVPSDVHLQVAKLGNSDSLQVGEWVIAVGNPYGFDRTVSFGIVSGKGRVLSAQSSTPLLNDFIQTDAAIAPGSSGGPLVNLNGEVIGINSRGMGQTQGFTIPINIAIEVKDKLMKTGNIERGWLGVITQPLNRSYAKYLGKPDMEGILVSDVLDGSPAAKAGLQAGDVLLKYDNDTLSAEKDDDLNRLALLISQSPVGAAKNVTVYRDGTTKKLSIEIGEQPKIKADEYETGLGFTVKEITDDMYRSLLLETKQGVYVSFVDVGTVADKASLFEGDVITEVNHQPTPDFRSFKAAINQAANDNYVLLSLLRGKERKLGLLDKSSIPSPDSASKTKVD